MAVGVKNTVEMTENIFDAVKKIMAEFVKGFDKALRSEVSQPFRKRSKRWKGQRVFRQLGFWL